MKRKTVKKLSKRILNLTAKIIANERRIEGGSRTVKETTGFTLQLVYLTAYNVPEHNIFNPHFYRISSTFKPIQEIQYTIDGVVFRDRIRIIFAARERIIVNGGIF